MNTLKAALGSVSKERETFVNAALWIAQAIGAAVFLMAGMMKAFRPREELTAQMGFVEDLTDSQVRNIGFLEIAGALGLVLPWLLDIAPFLTPLAGLGLLLTMVGAAVVHVRRDEVVPMVATNVVLGAIAAFVAIGRFGDL